MPGLSNYPDLYQIYNDLQTKNLNIVVSIDGVPDLLSLGTVYKRVRYGDPDLNYGDPGLVYGGLVERSNFRSILSIESNLVISQKIEPEQGRGSVATMSLVLVDVDGYATQLVTPGEILDEPLGGKLVKIYLGYKQSSYPEDYFVVFRGYISSIKGMPTKILLQLSDANTKRRGQVFFTSTTKLASSVAASDITIPVVRTDGFYEQIQGPASDYDSSVTTYINVDDEIMSYGPTDIAPSDFTVSRGARGTTPVAHDVNTDVSNSIQLQGNAIDLALKIMLSGWNGVWLEDQVPLSIQNTQSDLGIVTNALLLPNGVDAIEDYGLSPSDYVYVTGSTQGNNGTYVIQRIESVNDFNNNLIYMTTDFANPEYPASDVRMAFRSKYDVLPIKAGLRMKPTEIDIDTFETLRNEFFSGSEYDMQFYLDSAQSGKEFIEKEIMLPMGAYSVTRYGRISMAITLPPIAGEKIVTVDDTTLINPQNTTVERSLNNRKFFNEIQYQWDVNDAGEFLSNDTILDTTSLNQTETSSVLPIPSKGIKTSLGGQTLVDRRGLYLINRYKDACVMVSCQVNWRAGSMIEAGDVVLLKDQGTLKINNFSTGDRDLGVALFEVIERSLDIKTGSAKLTLLSSIGYQVNDRFGVISPSSAIIGSSNSPSDFMIEDSYGELFPGNEKRKWEQMVGELVEIHNYDYSLREETTLVGFDSSNPYRVFVSPALSFTPSDGFTMDVPSYPDSTDVNEQAMNKLLWAHWDSHVQITTASDTTSFDVATSDIDLFTIGNTVIVHNEDYSLLSNELPVLSIVGNTIIVDGDIGFVASDACSVDGISFKDHGGWYRIL